MATSINAGVGQDEKNSLNFKQTFSELTEYFNKLNQMVGELTGSNAKLLAILDGINRIRSKNSSLNQQIDTLLVSYQHNH
jgi:hypothetical protein